MRKRLKWLVPIIVLAALAGTFIVYTGDYYRADDAALRALESFGGVRVMRTGYGYRFDGPSEDAALVFYPGGKVTPEAYAPFLRRLAAMGVDVCLVKMPFRLALFGIESADAVMGQYDYPRWYVGGHSLGGAMAAAYATHHGDALAGVVLCAAYPTGALEIAGNLLKGGGKTRRLLTFDSPVTCKVGDLVSIGDAFYRMTAIESVYGLYHVIELEVYEDGVSH